MVTCTFYMLQTCYKRFVARIQIVILKETESWYQVYSYKTNKPHSLKKMERGEETIKFILIG